MRHAYSCRHSAVEQSRGIALVVALLVLGVIAGLSTLLANEFVLTMRRSENVLRGEQAWQYLLGAEELATLLLESDTDLDRDHLGEMWAQGMQAYAIEGGWLRGGLEDLQGKFNLNSLVRSAGEDGVQPPVPNTAAERRFMRLVRAVGGEAVDESTARALTEAIIDWIDADIEETGFGGAEDSAYGNREPPFRPANRAMFSVSELRMLPEMTPELYAALSPHVSSWPDSGADINVNTAAVPVLAALSPGELMPLDDREIESVLEARGEAGFETLQAFVELPVWSEPVPVEGLAQRSSWFQLRTEVEYDGLYWQMHSVLARKDNAVQVMARVLGEL